MEPCNLEKWGEGIYNSLWIINQDLADLCYFDVLMATGIIFFFSIYPHDTGISLIIVFTSYLDGNFRRQKAE